MSAIKRFFEKKKIERKFKKAGPGHSLNEQRQLPQSPARVNPLPTSGARGQTEEQQMAATAALTRMSAPRAGAATARTSKDSVRAQVKRELEQERLLAAQAETAKRAAIGPEEVTFQAAPVVEASNGVLYTCEITPDTYLPKKEMEDRIRLFLTEQLVEDAEMASALMIHTLNSNPDKVRVCIETISKYLDNIISNPGEEKFRKIRCGNKAFGERVAALKGSKEFLLSAGFIIERQDFQDGEDDFYVMKEEAADLDRLNGLKETLTNAEPIRPTLHRAMKLLHAAGNTSSRFGEIPREFYNITPEELKREQQARQEATERLGMLRTKAMRERDELKELRKYRYTMLRVRFPGDMMLQGTFKSTEKLSDLLTFVTEHLIHDWLPFTLVTAQGQKLSEESKTLAELHLVPACLVTFTCDQDMLRDAQAGSPSKFSQILKDDVLAQLQELTI